MQRILSAAINGGNLNEKTNTTSRRKGILAAVLASLMLTSTGVSAYADTNTNVSAAVSSSEDLTDIGGYACYQRDGSFFTLLDGEEYLVIDMSSMTLSADTKNNTYASFKPPSGWRNNTFISILNYQSYSEKVDLSKGDYYRPIFEIGQVLADYRIELSTDHILNHKYYMTFWSHYMYPIDEWDDYESEETFNLFVHTKILLTGTASTIMDAVCFEISSDSPGRNDFTYTITPIVKNS